MSSSTRMASLLRYLGLSHAKMDPYCTYVSFFTKFCSVQILERLYFEMSCSYRETPLLQATFSSYTDSYIMQVMEGGATLLLPTNLAYTWNCAASEVQWLCLWLCPDHCRGEWGGFYCGCQNELTESDNWIWVTIYICLASNLHMI